MSLKSDQWGENCAICGHTQYVHQGEEHKGACNAFTCKRDGKCDTFIRDNQ